MSDILMRPLWWGAGLVIASLLWQAAGVFAQSRGIVLFQGEVVEVPTSYLREAIYQLHQGKQSNLRFEPGIYLRWWVLRQGWPVTVLLFAGLILAVWRRTFGLLVLAGAVVVPYAVFVFAPFVVPRNLVAALPFASLLAAAALVIGSRELASSRLVVRTGRVSTGSKRERQGGTALGPSPTEKASVTATLGAALILGIVGGVMSWRLTAERSGFATASRYVMSSGGALSSSEIPVFYLRGGGLSCRAPGLPYTTADLQTFIQAGYRYAILDGHTSSPTESMVRQREPRVARYLAFGPVDVGESLISSENGDAPGLGAHTEFVDVYRLDPARLPPAQGGSYQPCTLDEVV